ncbi:LpqN/LpqT family lipoprotein [Mycobacterium sp. DL99]|uniref:LpqN/LpqT family lipoprotein n=1 Tax=Mycobacterium sp. DL99 TaxID=2528957 RepID=UPI001080F64B|nr:LpqN/LpqT family lipoprotein [Mycobacterium sp. DL99]
MRKLLAGLVTVGVSVSLVGCGTETKTESTTSAATTTSAAAERPNITGPQKTINDYITENKIAETPFKPNDPGTPDFDFPFPPDWSSAGDKTPAWAYGAIVYDKPADPADPPAIIAIASKLTGDVDAAEVLEYAPGMTQNLPDYKSVMDPEKSTLGGFEAIRSAGTYSHDGEARVIAQKTVVIPGNDALFVLQLNADAPEGQKDVVIDAAKIIDEQTKITP